MLKNIILLILSFVIILYILRSKNKEYFYVNPYNNQSNNLISNLSNNTQTNNYEYNDIENCFSKKNLFNKKINISISFTDINMNNYHNSENRKLFCKMENIDSEFESLLNNSLPYNNSGIYTGNNIDGNDWEIINLSDKSLTTSGFHYPKVNKCGFLIRNIKFNRYLSYGFLLKDLDNIQDNNLISDEEINTNVVYTGPSEYINENYLWDLKKVDCNRYTIQHVYSGMYLNSTLPNYSQDFVNIDNNSVINNFGEINCVKEKNTIWFIIPIKPIVSETCDGNYENCYKNLINKYNSIGGTGNCCSKKLETKLCMQGDKKNKKTKVLNYPSSPWCGITDSCS